MNKTNSEINEIKEIFLSKIGSTWIYDTLYLCLIVPMGAIGVILNSISLFIFLKRNLRHLSFFKYFQVYTLISIILSATVCCTFFLSPRYFFKLSTSYSARIFKCHVTPSYVIALFLFYSNALSVLLNLERASSFTEKFKRFKTISPYNASLYLFILCVIINIPTYFLIDMATDREIKEALSSLEKAKLFKGICLRNKNSLSMFGVIATLFGFVIKGLITLILDLISNVISMVYFKKYLKRKMKNLHLKEDSSNTTKKFLSGQIGRIESMRRKQTAMTIYLSLFSIVVYAGELSANLIVFFYSMNTRVLFAVEFVIFFLIGFKQIMNFLFFYIFNTNFQQYLKSIFRSNPNL